MDWLSNCVEGMHSRWLATSMSCCFSRLPERPEQELPGMWDKSQSAWHSLTDEALDKYREICYEQPQPTPPPKFDLENIRPASRSSHRTQWIAEGRNLASRASSRASFTTRRSVTRRPTIGTPYGFKRVEFPSGRTEGFRPLQLSIYLPGNELEPLPAFEEQGGLDLAHPPKALVKSRSESILSRPSTSFTIPRKPVASRSVSMDGSRFSIESGYTPSELNLRTRPRGQSIATTQSTQEFLDALDARLPQSPPLLRSKSGPEPVYTLYRRASEQSLRLRTHLQERQQIERRMPECDTILEEKHDDGKCGLSPISSHDSPIDVSELTHDKVLTQYSLSHPTTPSPPPTVLLPPLPTAESSPSLTLPIQAPSPLPLYSQASTTDLLQTKLYTPTEPPSVRARISQWLMRAASQSSPNLLESNASNTNNFDLRPSTDRTSTSSICTNYNDVELTSPWTTPRSSPHRKKSSLSSCHFSVPERGMSFDAEKHPAVVDVGCAF